MKKEAVELTLHEVRALGICTVVARDSGLLPGVMAGLDDDDERALFAMSLRSALVKLSDAEGKFTDVVELTSQERLDIAAARAAIDQEQAWLIDPSRRPAA